MIVSFLDSYLWELLSFSQKGLVVHGSRWSALRLMIAGSSHGATLTVGAAEVLGCICAHPLQRHVRARMDKGNRSSILNPGGVSLEKM